MSSRSILARLRRIQEQLPKPPRPTCVNHVRLCPFGNGHTWQNGATQAATAYWARHAVDFQSLPCEPGDPAAAIQRLAQAGVIATGNLVHIIGGVDLDSTFK